MNKKHRKTLEMLVKNPVPCNVLWDDIEKLFINLGAQVAEGNGSRRIKMNYKGYFGEVFYDDEAKLFYGEVIGLKDIITFQGTTVSELEKAFKDSIDDYIAWCEERGEEPEKTFSGKLYIKINPKLHAKLAQEAARNSVSLNSFIVEKLEK